MGIDRLKRPGRQAVPQTRATTEPLPVHVITGFLGSGKTTFLNKLIKMDAFSNSAIIVNEFGEVSLDHHLIEAGEEEIIELANGCVCCTVRGALTDALTAISARDPEHILIETTGLADPLPVAQSIIAHENPGTPLGRQLLMAGIWTLVDVEAAEMILPARPEAMRQLGLADEVILTKVDIIDPSDRASRQDAVTTLIRDYNRVAPVHSGDNFLEQLDTNPAFTKGNSGASTSRLASGFAATAEPRGQHSASIQAITLTAAHPVDRAAIDMFCDLLLSAHGNHIPRMKGLVAIRGETSPMLIQSAGSRLSEPVYLDHWPGEKHGEAPRETQRTAITVFLEGIEARFVRALFDGFTGQVHPDTPDKAALSDNPLSIGGIKF